MTLTALTPHLINLSMGLIVLGLGLSASFLDATYLFRHPGLLVRSLLAMNVIMPVFMAIIVALFNLHPAIKIAIVALALSPVPPVLPNKQTKAGGTAAYIVSLLIIAGTLAIVVVPLGTWLLTLAFSNAKTVPLGPIATVVAASVIVPLAIGLAIHEYRPDFAAHIARAVSSAGTILLLVAFISTLVSLFPTLWNMVGQWTILVLAFFTVVGNVVGHFLGGPVEDDRTVLGLAAGTRHPGVALAIAAAAFPEEKAVLAVVLWHLIIGGIVSGPYSAWRKRRHAGEEAPGL
jgi:bile acid:Na+ symporter, BASS family